MGDMSMKSTRPPGLSDDQRQQLIAELADALEELKDSTCAEMVPLWLAATRKERRHLGDPSKDSMGFQPSQRYLSLSKGSRSKYRTLAAWRHVMLWSGALRQISQHVFRRAVEAIYFTPYPNNQPPYAWSRRSVDAPGVRDFDSPTTMKNFAKEGCFESVEALRKRRQTLLKDGSWEAELRAMFLRCGVRETVRDVLKLEEFPEWEVDG